VLLYQEAIDTVLGVRSVAPMLFFEGSELMGLAETLLSQVVLFNQWGTLGRRTWASGGGGHNKT
jgi:hypothetical protein